MFPLRKNALLALFGLVIVTGFSGLPSAQAGKTILPGVKSYVFSMPPAKLQFYCDRRWMGRFWRVGNRYGCDNIGVIPRHHPRIDCLNRRCVIILTRGGGGGGDGGGQPSATNAPSNNQPSSPNQGGGTTSRP